MPFPYTFTFCFEGDICPSLMPTVISMKGCGEPVLSPSAATAIIGWKSIR